MAGARRVRVKVEIYDSVLEAETAPGGDLNRYLARENRLVYRFAVAGAPLGKSGELKRSHVNAGVRKVGRMGAVATVNNTAEHAPWVHDGTTGPIRATRGRYMSVPAARGSARRIRRITVAGQRANPWLYRAAVKAAAMMGGEVRRGRA